MKPAETLYKCSQCLHVQATDSPGGSVQCSRCASWDLRRMGLPWVGILLWFILVLVAAAAGYFLRHPRALARLLGL